MMNASKPQRIDSLVTFALLLTGMGTFCFASIMNILGLAEQGSSWSGMLSSYTIALALLCICVFVSKCAKGVRFSKTTLLFCGIIIIICLGFCITSTYANGASYYFFLFASTALPGFLAGLLIGLERYLIHAWKYMDIFMLIFTLSLFSYHASNQDQASYAIDYQTASYMGALAFGLNICLLVDKTGKNRFKLFSTKAWSVASVGLLVFQIEATLQTGGRGGTLLLAVFAGLAALLLFKTGTAPRRIFLFAFLIMGALLVYEYIAANQDQAGIARILSGRDNRSDVYTLAWDAFLENPILGYGPYGYAQALKGIEYPHNLLLELLLMYGIVGIPFEALSLIVLVVRFRKCGFSSFPKWSIVLSLYALVRLLFSSTFLSMSLFWFVIGFFGNAHPDRQSAILDRALDSEYGKTKAMIQK